MQCLNCYFIQNINKVSIFWGLFYLVLKWVFVATGMVCLLGGDGVFVTDLPCWRDEPLGFVPPLHMPVFS